MNLPPHTWCICRIFIRICIRIKIRVAFSDSAWGLGEDCFQPLLPTNKNKKRNYDLRYRIPYWLLLKTPEEVLHCPIDAHHERFSVTLCHLGIDKTEPHIRDVYSFRSESEGQPFQVVGGPCFRGMIAWSFGREQLVGHT